MKKKKKKNQETEKNGNKNYRIGIKKSQKNI